MFVFAALTLSERILDAQHDPERTADIITVIFIITVYIRLAPIGQRLKIAALKQQHPGIRQPVGHVQTTFVYISGISGECTLFERNRESETGIKTLGINRSVGHERSTPKIFIELLLTVVLIHRIGGGCGNTQFQPRVYKPGDIDRTSRGFPAGSAAVGNDVDSLVVDLAQGRERIA